MKYGKVTTNETVEFMNICAGFYDDTMKCPDCNFIYEDKADNSFAENTENSKHYCEDYQ